MNYGKNIYSPIEEDYAKNVDTDNYDFIDEFDEGFLNSLRKVLVRLENENIFAKIKTTTDFWTLVTQIDADTDEEEILLEEIRQQLKNS